MREIKFPRSGKVLTAEEAGYTDMVKQVRDSEFEKHLHEGLYPAAQDKQKALELAETKAADKRLWGIILGSSFQS